MRRLADVLFQAGYAPYEGYDHTVNIEMEEGEVAAVERAPEGRLP